MGKILQRLSLFVGLLLFLFDYGSDIYVAVQYWKNNEVWWFWMTIGFISVPSIIVNITAIVQLINTWRCIMAILQLSIVVRYIEALISPVSKVYFLAKLRYLETITESAPQLCLQLYIMLRQWYFPSYARVSSVLSLLSLAWSITTLEEERAIEENRDFKLTATGLFVFWQLFTLISGLSAIVLFAYVFRYYVIIFLAAHWLLLAVVMLIIQRSDGNDSLGKSLFLSCLAAYPSLFHSSETVLPTKSPKVEMIVGYVFIVVKNIIMVRLSLTIEMPDAPHMDILQPVAISCVVGGSVMSFINFIFCCRCMDFGSSSPERSGEDEPDNYSQDNYSQALSARTISYKLALLWSKIETRRKVSYMPHPNHYPVTGYMNATVDHPNNDNTQMYHASQALSSRGTISQDEPADHCPRDENLELSFMSLPNHCPDIGRMNTTVDHRNNDNTQMNHPSDAFSSRGTIPHTEPADHSPENESLGSYIYGTIETGVTSVCNVVSSFFNPYPDSNSNR